MTSVNNANKMFRQRRPHTPQVGNKTSAASVETTVEFPEKTTTRAVIGTLTILLLCIQRTTGQLQVQSRSLLHYLDIGSAQRSINI